MFLLRKQNDGNKTIDIAQDPAEWVSYQNVTSGEPFDISLFD